MNALIQAAFSRSRVVVMALLMILTVGAYAYMSIPKESSPEIPIPIFYVSTGLDGISPQDAERLLVEPLETELSAITGLKQMTSNAGEGYASVQLDPIMLVDERRHMLLDMRDDLGISGIWCMELPMDLTMVLDGSQSLLLHDAAYVTQCALR